MFAIKGFMEVYMASVQFTSSYGADKQLAATKGAERHVWPNLCTISLSLLQGFTIGCAIFVAWKLTKFSMKMELCSILLISKLSLLGGLLNKDPTIWITGTNQPTPASQPPWYGLHPGFVWHTHPSKFFKLSNFMHYLVNCYAAKILHPNLVSLKQVELYCIYVGMH